MRAREWCRRTQHNHRVLVEIAVIAAFYLAIMRFVQTHVGLEASGTPEYKLTAAGIAIAAVAYASLLVRWRYPVSVVAIATLAVITTEAVSSSAMLAGPAMIFAVGVMARRSERNMALAVGGVVAVAVMCGGIVFTSEPWYGSANLHAVPWVGLAVAAGQAARHKHAYVEALKERADRAEQSRDEEARRRVHAERLRIARELHDAVGHHVALINVQAGAGEFMLDDRPDETRKALGQIRRASREALEELSITVGLLRQPGDREPTEPAPGLARLDELIGSFESAGLPVTREVAGEERPLPEAVDLTVYRVVQESLTNTRKHAEASAALVRLSYEAAQLRLVVEDDGRADGQCAGQGEGTSEGHGIIGMRERVAAVGGSLTAGPRATGGFLVAAVLPIPAG